MKPILPPVLSIIDTDTPLPVLTTTESPPAPTELARPPVFKNVEYLAVNDADGDWHLAVSVNQVLRAMTETEARQAASILNEQGSNIITLYCRTEKCQYIGSWLKRSTADAKKNLFFCEGCKQPMTR